MGRPSKFTAQAWEQALALRAQGVKARDIQAQTGVTPSALKVHCSRRGLALPPEVRKTLTSIGAPVKYGPEVVALVVALRKEGLTLKAISERLNLTIGAVGTLLCREGVVLPPDHIKASYQARGLACSVTGAIKAGYDTPEAYCTALAAAHSGRFEGSFTDSKAVTTWVCKKGHPFEMRPNAVQQGQWCPICSLVGPSRGQLELADAVRSWGLDVVVSTRDVIPPMEVDIWVPSKGVAIEYNGLYHHSFVHGRTEARHHKKWRRLYDTGHQLFAVFEDEWFSKRALVSKMLQRRLGLFNGRKVGARQCSLVELGAKDASAFLEVHHLDGAGGLHKGLGLVFQGSLVAAMSFRRNFAGEYEVARFATHHDLSIPGAGSRLVAAYPNRPLVSYSNNRLSRGGLYQKLGFRFVQANPSSYWYTDGKVRVWRWRCRRNNDPAVRAEFPTEEEQAAGGVFSEKLFGDRRPLYKIEDYGHLKWILE